MYGCNACILVNNSLVYYCFPDNTVYAWGNNAMGQCGQGHSQSPVTRPKRVVGLNKVPIHQISAGTSHSMAWTAIPSDRYKEFLKITFYNQICTGF